MLPVRDRLPTRLVPGVNYLLIALNVAVFLAQRLGKLDAPWGLVPAKLLADPIGSLPSLFGYMFLHASLGHIGGNMLFLWIFGDNVEDAMGHARYLAFYVACGLVAAFAQVAMDPGSRLPLVGASGAISGVLAAYGVLYPRSPISVINPIPLMWLFWGLLITLPAWLVIAEFFVVNLWSALGSAHGGGGVAFTAHVGGFVAGLVLLPAMRRHDPVDHDRWDRALGPRRAGRA